jgi:hypothetical protein
MELASRRARVVSLLVAGVLVFADSDALAAAGFIAAVAILLMIGFVDERLSAVAWAVILVASAFVADFLWHIDWEPFNRSDDLRVDSPNSICGDRASGPDGGDHNRRRCPSALASHSANAPSILNLRVHARPCFLRLGPRASPDRS